MRLEKLNRKEEEEWRERFRAENWILGSLTLGITLPEYAKGETPIEAMHFGYYLQPLHLSLHDREELPRKLLWALAHRRPPLDFLELVGAGIRVPHAFPPGFTANSVLRITLQELQRLPLTSE
ncbi:MAG TPA: hypothetical protein VMT00_11120 [Thermoanaerobaculia bacterium]|nr:hypothetical protein [Thermoanaerobaculia bacterium]